MFYWGDYMAMGILWTVAWFLIGYCFGMLRDKDRF